MDLWVASLVTQSLRTTWFGLGKVPLYSYTKRQWRMARRNWRSARHTAHIHRRSILAKGMCSVCIHFSFVGFCLHHFEVRAGYLVLWHIGCLWTFDQVTQNPMMLASPFSSRNLRLSTLIPFTLWYNRHHHHCHHQHLTAVSPFVEFSQPGHLLVWTTYFALVCICVHISCFPRVSSIVLCPPHWP